MQRISSTGRKSDANLTDQIQRLDSMIKEAETQPSKQIAKHILTESDEKLNML